MGNKKERKQVLSSMYVCMRACMHACIRVIHSSFINLISNKKLPLDYSYVSVKLYV